MNIDLMTGAKYIYNSEHYVRSHFHPYYEILVYLDGNGRSVINGKPYDFSENTVFLIPPKMFHDEKFRSSGGQVLCIGFDCRDFPYTVSDVCAYFEDTDEIVSLAKTVYEELKAQLPYYKKKVTDCIENIVIELARKDKAMGDRDSDSLQAIYNYIVRNFANKIDFKILAAESGFSYDYFRRVFRNKFGVSPQKVLMEQRFNTAKQLLENPEIPITAIAMASGFSDSSQFSHMFRQRYKRSPKEYREHLPNFRMPVDTYYNPEDLTHGSEP